MKQQNDTAKVLTINKIISFYGNQGIFDSAEYYSKQMLALSEELGYQRGMCIAYNTFGIPEMVNGQFQKALEYFFKSLSIAEKNKLDQDVTVASRNIAAVFILQQEFKLALPYLRKVLQRVTLLKDSVRIFPVLTDIGSCLDEIGSKDSAKFYFESGISMCSVLADREMPEDIAGNYYQAKTKVYEKTSQYYLANGRHRDALNLLMDLWAEIKESPDIYTKIAILNSIALSYKELQKTDSVLFYSDAVINLAESKDYPDGLKDAYLFRADALFRTGKFKEAYNDQVMAASLKDSVFSAEKFKAIQELQTRYETEKKEERINVLSREKKSQRLILGGAIAAGLIALGLLLFAIRANRLQKKLFQKEKESQRAEMEREVFELQQTALRAQMNPHFIFNSLNSVQRFVLKNDTRGVNTYLTAFASLIRQTLENSGKSLVLLKDELQYLETYIQVERMRSSDQFEYELILDEQLDPENIYIPNMLIQPFVENSILHGMYKPGDEKGKLKITIRRGKKLEVVVEDNGPGLIRKMAESSTQSNDHSPMGTAITAQRIEMYNKLHDEKITCVVEDKATDAGTETGTRVRLTFSLNPKTE